MPEFIPKDPAFRDGTTLKVFGLLDRTLGADWRVWQRLPDRNGPDFLILAPGGGALALKVSPLAPADLSRSRSPDLFAMLAPEKPALSVDGPMEALIAFLEAIGLEEAPEVAALFPNLRQAEAAAEVTGRWPPDLALAGRETLSPGTFGQWVESRLSPPLSPRAWERARRVMAPEAVIPLANSARARSREGRDAGLTEALLDYSQEWLAKIDLALSDEARLPAREFGLRLINGPAGSGKSLVLLHRAALLAELFPQARILLLTHNRPLIGDLHNRLARLTVRRGRVETMTFSKLAMDLYTKAARRRPNVVQYGQRANLVKAAHQAHLAGSALDWEFLQAEFDWIQDSLIRGLDDYLAADRRGRGIGLSEEQRRRVYAAWQRYQQALRGEPDWSGVTVKALEWVESGRVVPEPYDFILLDEAQFAAPSWFELLKRLLRPGTGHLFCAADPGQGFLRGGRSWASAGLAVAGRAHRLQSVYRTTQAIMEAAIGFYLSRHRLEEAAFLLPGRNEAPPGTPPRQLRMRDEHDEAERIAAEIEGAIQGGVPAGSILVIPADQEALRLVEQALVRRLGRDKVWHLKGERPTGDAVRLCPLNTATGLESPIVFVTGLHRLFDPENSPLLGEERRAELRLENSRKLYMAMTRAAGRLVLSGVGEWNQSGTAGSIEDRRG